MTRLSDSFTVSIGVAPRPARISAIGSGGGAAGAVGRGAGRRRLSRSTAAADLWQKSPDNPDGAGRSNQESAPTRLHHFPRVSFSFSRQMNSISSVFGDKVTSTVVPHGLV